MMNDLITDCTHAPPFRLSTRCLATGRLTFWAFRIPRPPAAITPQATLVILMRPCFAFALLVLWNCGRLETATASDDTFEKVIAPIFQQKCVSCHNDTDQKGGYSLETVESAFSGGAIEPQDAEASYLLELIIPVDGEAEMPRDAAPLSPDEVEAIQTWIDQGAEWPEAMTLKETFVANLDWWSLRPLVRPPIPNLQPDNDAFAIRTPIDAFIWAKLQEQGLTPSVEADRRTLLRRLYFDLLGLPPTPGQIDAFVSDESPDAYETMVDQLLASEGYGERWARHWLDVVHYADTHGYDKDKLRENAWPYRDYVIRSFNQDKPYGRFVREQLAGDILWPKTEDGITGTGFIATGPWDFIGHVEVSESKIDGRIARHLDRDDMVSSTMNSFCSVTVQCARCHNHKFDPVSQEHYYSLQSIFSALDRADAMFDRDPAVAKARDDLSKHLASLKLEQAAIEASISAAAGPQLPELDSQLSVLQKQKTSGASSKPEFGYHSGIEAADNITKWVQVDLGETSPIQAIEIVGCHDDFNGIGHGFGFPVRYRIEASDDANFANHVKLLIDHTSDDVENPGTSPQRYELTEVTHARFVRVTATQLAERANDYIFALAEVTIESPTGDNIARGKQVTALDSIEAPVRWQRSNLVDGYYYGVASSANLDEEIAVLTKERADLLARTVSEELRDQASRNLSQIEEAQTSLADLPPQMRAYVGKIHTGSGNFVGTGAQGGMPRDIHVLNRGNILQPLQKVEPGTIPILPNVDWRFQLDGNHSEGDRRVALADWIVRDDNPLTWRSVVNRIWQYHFGRGIVDSPNDFGRMGQLPSHPELLDWLAVEFRDGGQSFKKLHKQILMSSVYRQVSDHHDDNAAIDSENAYLWRMNRRRMTAEEIRDAVLSVSGKLDRTMYGPGFRLFVLERPEHSPHYEYHKHDPNDPATHRRSIYRFVVRSQPDPFMTTLDCADSSQSVAKRDETTTALQALSLLNNKFVLSMSTHFAERLARESDSVADQVDSGFRLVSGHPPNAEHKKLLVEYANEHGMDNLCRVLLNLNEFVFID